MLINIFLQFHAVLKINKQMLSIKSFQLVNLPHIGTVSLDSICDVNLKITCYGLYLNAKVLQHMYNELMYIRYDFR